MEFNIGPYDRSFQRFWLGAIGDLVQAPQANCNNARDLWKFGLRWIKLALRTTLCLSNDTPHRPSRHALPTIEFEPSYRAILTFIGINNLF